MSDSLNSDASVGFIYLVEVVKAGEVVDSEIVHNMMPLEGLNHVLGVTLKGAVQSSAWYIGLYEGAYTPQASDTAATFPALATESTAYAETTRVPFVSGAVAGGALDNTANRAEFTMNAAKTIYGGFLTSASAKGATAGVLLSLVRFTSPKVLDSGSVLRVTAGISFASA